jgi:hypothetical protein
VPIKWLSLGSLAVARAGDMIRMSEDIKKWLEEHGLGKYLGAFEENEIGVAELPLLTNQDLREMGLPIGPRRRFLSLMGAGPETIQKDVPARNSPQNPFTNQ